MITKKIPTLFPHNHASNIIALSNGDMLCAWFGGSCEGKPDISIQASRLKKGAAEWSEPVLLTNDATRSEQNPILFERSPGVVWLIYTAQIGIHQNTAVVRWRMSEDYGHTWSEIRDLFAESGIFVRNPPIMLGNGDILLPAYYCVASETGFLGEDFSIMKRSTDGGTTWTEVRIEGSTGLVHLSIVAIDEHKIIGFFRSRLADYIYKTESFDGGVTWSVPVPTELPNNNASIQCKKLADQRLVMIYNDTDKWQSPPKENRPPWFDKKDMDEIDVKKTDKPSSVWGVPRNPLCIAVSNDGGNRWENVCTLISKEGFEGEPEFSYPSIAQDQDGHIHATFTYLRQYICHKIMNDRFE
ncbi:BNR repeat-containing glycosyl hydrolase [Candidatus Moduliflexus flocculans]|uniref:BNR repeat-containing glycosyl hydrolase n=1 Tax=Candidatus Moduliflexus flocculans TaxID=1499966 RepID=A0A0S6VQX0_9BACT|nr:BNR repeat-containing glycosyl hydrolase [Candidatus Moduliflexus flocculans]